MLILPFKRFFGALAKHQYKQTTDFRTAIVFLYIVESLHAIITEK